jgi:hypothetical protein
MCLDTLHIDNVGRDYSDSIVVLFLLFEGMVSEHTNEVPRVCATFVIKLAIYCHTSPLRHCLRPMYTF